MSTIIKVNKDFDVLDSAAEALRDGKLVAFPTETVYGLGANALNENAVKEIFIAKGRPQDNPLIVHVAKKSQIAELAREIPEKAQKIIDNLMPGPITVVLYKNDTVPDVVTAGGPTVAIRIPENEIARALIERAGVPVAAPSANISGKPSPTKAQHVKDDLDDKVSFIVDGGSCRVGLESTVIDMTVTPPAILRPGGVTHEQLAALLGEVRGYEKKDADEKSPKSPGMKYRHYAPRGEMTVFMGTNIAQNIKTQIDKNPNKKICVLAASDTDYNCDRTFVCGKNPEEYSKNLFDFLREADSLGAEIIFAEFPFADGGITTALYNRIYKSCGGRVVLCK